MAKNDVTIKINPQEFRLLHAAWQTYAAATTTMHPINKRSGQRVGAVFAMWADVKAQLSCLWTARNVRGKRYDVTLSPKQLAMLDAALHLYDLAAPLVLPEREANRTAAQARNLRNAITSRALTYRMQQGTKRLDKAAGRKGIQHDVVYTDSSGNIIGRRGN